MVQLGGLLVAILLVVSAAMAMKSCDARRSEAVPVARQAFDDQVLVLNDVTMVAPRGTVGRSIADWMRAPGQGTALFDLGGRQFEGQSLEPRPDSIVRIRRFATLMREFPSVHATVLGFDGGARGTRLDKAASKVRAEEIARRIHEQGVSSSRLSWRAGEESEIAAAGFAGGGAAPRVAILLSH